MYFFLYSGMDFDFTFFLQIFPDFYGKKRYILISSLSISTSGLYYMEHPFALILDPIFGAIFWTDIGTDNPKIERARLDGSDRKIIINSEIKSPKGISLDSKRRKIYWCDTALNSLFSAGNVLIIIDRKILLLKNNFFCNI